MADITLTASPATGLTPASLLERLRTDYPAFTFETGDAFCWSPADKKIIYEEDMSGDHGLFSLLHEIGHGSLDHRRYTLDFELVSLEVAAWEQAGVIAGNYGIALDADHVQDCLDSYRDWLHRRAICPECTTRSLQDDSGSLYRCFNCHTTWKVPPSRFCRPYRRSAA